MYAIKHKIMAAGGFENPCDIALIYYCDGENVADESGALYMLNITLQCSQNGKYFSVTADTYCDNLNNVVGSILSGLDNYRGQDGNGACFENVDCDDDAPAVYKILCEQLGALHADNGQLPNGIGRYFETCE